MVNLIGAMPDRAEVLAVPGAHLHDYEKEPRAERKVGHVTVRADDDPTLDDRLATLSGVVDPTLNDETRR
jgi:5-(carboxyamino)imidazole ribonucleotide synthase